MNCLSCSWALTTLIHRALFRNCYDSYFFLFDLYRVHCLWDSWVCGRKILETEIKRSAVWSWKARKLPEHPETTFLTCKIKNMICLPLRVILISRLNENMWKPFVSMLSKCSIFVYLKNSSTCSFSGRYLISWEPFWVSKQWLDQIRPNPLVLRIVYGCFAQLWQCWVLTKETVGPTKWKIFSI